MLKKFCQEFYSLSYLTCDLCQFAKFHRLSSRLRVSKRVCAPFELIHFNIWGFVQFVSQTSFCYFVTVVDDYTHVTWLYLMKSCLELSHFCVFHVEI